MFFFVCRSKSAVIRSCFLSHSVEFSGTGHGNSFHHKSVLLHEFNSKQGKTKKKRDAVLLKKHGTNKYIPFTKLIAHCKDSILFYNRKWTFLRKGDQM